MGTVSSGGDVVRVFLRGDVYYTHVGRGANRRQVSTGCRDRRAAEAVAREFERRSVDPTHAASREKTVDHALALALTEIHRLESTKRRSAGTSTYYTTKAGHVSRLMGKVLLGDLNAAIVRDYEHSRRAEGVRDHTIAKERQVLRVALRLALEREWWTGPVERVVYKGFDSEYAPRTRWLSPDEVHALLAHLEPDRAARVAWIIVTGSRWSETERARREHVSRNRTEVQILGTKTQASKRTVPIVSLAAPLLEFALEHARGQNGLLFEPWTSPVLTLRRACRDAKIPPCTPNDLRRTLASWLVQAGVPDSVVARVLGHTTDRMVRQVYGQAPASSLRDSIERCITGASTSLPVDALLALPASVSEAEFSAETVPRDGIEPPTRGFSVLWSLRAAPEKNRGSAGDAVHIASRVHQRVRK